MNRILYQAITVIGCIPPGILILKLIFKKSIMYTFSWLMLIVILWVSFTSAVGGLLGGRSILWVSPSNFALAALAFMIINRRLKIPLEKAINQVKKVSEGDLEIQVDRSSSENELGILTNALTDLVGNMQGIIGRIDEDATQLLGVSQEISNSAIRLAESSNEQASSIEEISATMEEISSNIRKNSENAQETDRMSTESSTGFVDMAEKSRRMVDANKDIAGKIVIINEIAFQTNLLALNAAIEAARAGDFGKGFAVVATEVRKLSERSKISAGEIVGLSDLILKLSESTSAVMTETMPKIKHTTELVHEITSATREQDIGVDQVNSAIQQLNGVTQHTASSSEELASSAEALAEQARELKSLISYFRLARDSRAAIT